MNTLTITANDVQAGTYMGGSINTDGHIEIEANLGTVWFRSISAAGRIHAREGTGIVSRLRVSAGLEIVADSGINAGNGIIAGDGINSRGGIIAGSGIFAGGGIIAGGKIVAGSEIRAEGEIVSELGIHAGLGITAGGDLSAKLRIFAGLCMWREPWTDEMKIRCRRLIRGTVAYGTLIETDPATPPPSIAETPPSDGSVVWDFNVVATKLANDGYRVEVTTASGTKLISQGGVALYELIRIIGGAK